MRIIATTDADFEQQLSRITGRMELLEQAQPPAVRKKTVEVFGRPLSPSEVVREIIADVRSKGDEAVFDYARRLDGLQLDSETVRVPQDEIDSACDRIEPALLAALQKAADNVWRYQQHILTPEPPPLVVEGRTLQSSYRPVEVAGVYIPGGLAPYPSSLIMGAVPALAAGVKRVYVCSLPLKDGSMHPAILAAAKVCGVREMYRLGGVPAIAAMAFGTASVPKADKIVGPGNYFVTLAKKEIYGYADIDLFAGPSEILVLADDSADPAYVAADLLSQAEHGSMASAVMVTTSSRLAAQVQEKLDQHLAVLPNRDVAGNAMKEYGAAIIARDTEECIRLANRIAPEHLEILFEEPERYIDSITNAGAIFVGPYTPEPVGDYIAGSSHILPTGGTAKFFSGLTANSFLRRTSIVRYDRQALEADVDAIAAIARAEGFHAHALSAEIRKRTR